MTAHVLKECTAFISQGQEVFTQTSRPPDNADSTYHSHPTARNDIPEDQNPLLFVPYSWEHCPMHYESLHTPPALQGFTHWYILNVYHLLRLSVVNFTLCPPLSVFKQDQPKKTFDIMSEL